MSITMKTHHRCAKAGMKSAVLLPVLLLSACANFPFPQAVGANGAAPENRQAEVAAQPAPPPQKPAPAEPQQPAAPAQGDSLPAKPKHAVEED
jgi:hypothetical protein